VLALQSVFEERIADKVEQVRSPGARIVAEQEGKPAPKVIEFGLAKALAWQEADATTLTPFGSVVGTLNGADTGRNDVDTRGDVYSLGAVLYELVTGSAPLDRERLRGIRGGLEAHSRRRHPAAEQAPAPVRHFRGNRRPMRLK